VHSYNHDRPHQAIGRVPPFERFRLADPKPGPVAAGAPVVVAPTGPVTTRRVSSKGTISFATARYKAGRWLAGQSVEVVCEGGLVQLSHRGVLIATHARRHQIDKQAAGLQRAASLVRRP
jgi:Mu transposase, C-terminal domain